MRLTLFMIAALGLAAPLQSHGALVDCDEISSDETFKIVVGSRGSIGSRRGIISAINLKLHEVKAVLHRDDALAGLLVPSIKLCEDRWAEDRASYSRDIVLALMSNQVLLEMHPHAENDETSLHFAIVPLRHRTMSAVPPLGFHESVYGGNEFVSVISSTSELEAFVAIAYALYYEDLAAQLAQPGMLNYAYDLYCVANTHLEAAKPLDPAQGLLEDDWLSLRDFVAAATQALVQTATSTGEDALRPLRTLFELTGTTCVSS